MPTLLLMLVGGLFILSPLNPADPTPGPRYGHELIYDEAREVTILFGGFGEDGESNAETWSFDGNAWVLVAEEGPSPRRWPAMAYDHKRSRLILHGGREGTGQSGESLADTWAWDGTRWTRLATDGPSGRDHHRMVYDRGRDRVVLFGGWDGEKVVGDTWEWDGTRWQEHVSNGPPARAPFGLAYDEARAEVLLFGGGDLDHAYGDTWRWKGERWERIDVDGPSPARRTFHGATYDPDTERVLVFSGRDGETLLRDTWAWDGARWTLLGEPGPLRRGVYALAYDRRLEVALFHGSGLNEDGRWNLESTTWLWDGAVWRVVHPSR